MATLDAPKVLLLTNKTKLTLTVTLTLTDTVMQKSKTKLEIKPIFRYCSGPEQRRFGPVSEHFLFRSGTC